MNFELGKEYIVSVTEKGIIPIVEFDITKFFGDGHYEHQSNFYSCRQCKFRNLCVSKRIVEKCATNYCPSFELDDEEDE